MQNDDPMQKPVKLILVAGARPNFMKVAPLLRELTKDLDFACRLVHTGQHYDHNMSGRFFEDLNISEPDYHLQVGSGSHTQQTAEIMRRFEPVMDKEVPDAVVVAGDVNSTVACALVAKKMGCQVVHVEAGLRSFDRSMPEEINRIVTDSISDVLMVSEESGRRNLLHEGIPEDRICFVGNLMIDSLRHHLGAAQQNDIAKRIGAQGAFGIVTLHRPANVDNPVVLGGILRALAAISQELPLYFPVHPRTEKALASLRYPDACLHMLPPLGYIEFLSLMAQCRAVFTDSGGVQEESTALQIPCVTIRNNTERPATVEEGTNILAGTDEKGIAAAWEQVRQERGRGRIPRFWDGNAAPRCREALRSHFGMVGFEGSTSVGSKL